MKKILVTGGAGFIGSNLCERLLSQGNEVVCMDNFSSGNVHNVRHLRINPNFSIIEHDVIYPYSTDVDVIYNLACPASPVLYQADPIKTLKTSVLGAINMLELARETNATILLASTSEIYGDPQIHPQVESYCGNVNTTGIRACYDEGKRCAETLFMDYHRRENVDVKIVRIFNTYGKRMHPCDGRVIPNFIMQALSGEDITIYGHGGQTRSFLYVDDLIEALLKMTETEKGFTGPVNIGNPSEMTIRQLSDMIIEMCGSRSGISHLPLPSDDPVRRKPDISIARNKLGWNPTVDINTGLQSVVEYFKKLSNFESRDMPLQNGYSLSSYV